MSNVVEMVETVKARKEVVNLQTGEILDWNRVDELKDNCLLKTNPKLWIEWDIKKNNDLGYDIYKMSYGSNKKVWWKCPKCKSNYDRTIKDRKNSKGCPYCSGTRVNHTNSLASIRPDLASEWHPTKNGEFTPEDVACNKSIKVWWIGKECGHEWDATIYNRNFKSSSCPYCSSPPQRLLKGFNDLWTTNPEIAKLLLNKEEGYKYSYGSAIKTNWKCLVCKKIINNKSFESVYRNGISCPTCSDGISYPEKVMYNLLASLNVNFKPQKSFTWSNRKRYDFYLTEYNLIIETHGKQHYEEASRTRGRTFEEEQENDRYKEQLAKDNGIEHYVVVDCRKSDIEWIKDSVFNSELANIFNLSGINWNEINKQATKSLVFEVCKKYNVEDRTPVKTLAREFKLGKKTISNYLQRGNDLGIIEYKDITKRIVVQLSMKGEFIAEYATIKEASETTGAHQNVISSCLAGRTGSSGGYRWVSKEDYGELYKRVYTS